MYIYKKQNDRYAAYKRFPCQPYQGKCRVYNYFQKAGLFYSFEEAKEWLELLPEKMDRPTRDAPAECQSSD
jgi:hypothetical protein